MRLVCFVDTGFQYSSDPAQMKRQNDKSGLCVKVVEMVVIVANYTEIRLVCVK